MINYINEENLKKQQIKQNALSQERLKELFLYNEYTGEFIRKEREGDSRYNKMHAGKPVKSNLGKYTDIHIDGYSYKAHRLVWLYVYGKWPEYTIDHVNREKSDNRLSNLRDVPMVVNLENLPEGQEGRKRGRKCKPEDEKRNNTISNIKKESTRCGITFKVLTGNVCQFIDKDSRELLKECTLEEAREVYMANDITKLRPTPTPPNRSHRRVKGIPDGYKPYQDETLSQYCKRMGLKSSQQLARYCEKSNNWLYIQYMNRPRVVIALVLGYLAIHK